MINVFLYIILYFNKKLRSLVINDIDIITNRCAEIANRENKDQKNSENFHNTNCPNCKAKKKDIVNKISNVEGKTTIVNYDIFGFRKENTITAINTNEINHCNICGNEWKKFKSKSITKAHILKLALNYLSQIIQNPDEKEKEWKLETIGVFEGCYAETIYKLGMHNKIGLHRSNFKLRDLRKQYKSIFK